MAKLVSKVYGDALFEAAHCNFHLRGEESDRDERFVNELCKGLGVTLHVTHFDTVAYASRHHVSIEMGKTACGL